MPELIRKELILKQTEICCRDRAQRKQNFWNSVEFIRIVFVFEIYAAIVCNKGNPIQHLHYSESPCSLKMFKSVLIEHLLAS